MMRAGCGTFTQIQTEAEIIEQRELEADKELARRCRIFQVIENDIKRLEEMRMGIALRQKTQKGRKRLHAVDGCRAFHQPART